MYLAQLSALGYGAGRVAGRLDAEIAAMRGAINGLMAEVIEDHIQVHVVNPSITSKAERMNGAAELIEVIRAYLK